MRIHEPCRFKSNAQVPKTNLDQIPSRNLEGAADSKVVFGQAFQCPFGLRRNLTEVLGHLSAPLSVDVRPLWQGDGVRLGRETDVLKQFTTGYRPAQFGAR